MSQIGSVFLPAGSVATRPVFWGFTPALKVLWYALAILSVLVFIYGIVRPVAKYRRANRAGMPGFRELPGRVSNAFRLIASQRTVRRRDPAAGWAHAAMFYGFLTLFAGTVILSFQTDFTEPVFGWKYFNGAFYLGYSLVLDLLGLALLGGLVFMMVRRSIARPSRLDYTRPDRSPDDPAQERRGYRVGDWAFVILLVVIVLTGYVLEGVRIAMSHPGYNGYSPVGWVVSRAMVGWGAPALAAFRHALWWFHGLIAISFVASIPYTKAFHMLADVVSLVLRDPQAGKRQRPLPVADPGVPAGYGAIGDLRLVHMIQLDACTKCGKCHEVCPANAVGRPLSPRDVVLELREQVNQAAADSGIGGVLGTLMGRPPEAMTERSLIGDAAVRSETIWSCFQCNACVEICPVGIEQAPMINEMRRRLIDEGTLDPGLQSTLQKFQRSGNSFGENRKKRGRWTRELEFEVKDARVEAVDLLWFVGDYASFDPRSQEITRSFARILRHAGVDFGILYDGERNAGNDVRRVGEEGLFELLAEHNIGTLEGCDFNRIVTTDPHSLNTLCNEYPALRDGSWDVVHHSIVLDELAEAGRLGTLEPLGRRVTYHDPCFLGRHNGVYDAPRTLLARLGCELIEMPRNRDNSFCCGAGGGQIWIPDRPGTERPSVQRIAEAAALGDLDHFVVACPKDVTMFEDAIKVSGADFDLLEIVELMAESMRLLVPADDETAVT